MMEYFRYFMELAYRGTRYHGWQVQYNSNTVQEEINRALSTLFRYPVPTMGSGRTDTGVHAKLQVMHFDTTSEIPEEEIKDWVKRLNAILPRDISVYAIKAVHKTAHARFDALWRSYEYYITQRKNPFEDHLSWCCFYQLDLERMNQACSILLTYRNFQCFSRIKTEVNHYECEIKTAVWEQKGEHLIFHITANRFLRGMVRAIVGTMVEIGRGKIDMDDFRRILEKKDRREAGSAAPACGLYLSEVVYPDKVYLYRT